MFKIKIVHFDKNKHMAAVKTVFVSTTKPTSHFDKNKHMAALKTVFVSTTKPTSRQKSICRHNH